MANVVPDFKKAVNEFLTPERIKRCNDTGNAESDLYNVRFGQLEIRDRNWKGVVERHFLQNSPLNRPLNLDNPIVIIDKIRYAIEIIAEQASIEQIPVSYILTYDMYGVPQRLYMKDRGHIIHVLNMLAAIYLNKKVWLSVVAVLGNCRGSSRLMGIRDNILSTTETMDDTTKISVKDMLGTEMYNNLLNLVVNIRVSAESLTNHVEEMEKINNGNNGWTPHNYGMLRLKSLDSIIDPSINMDDIYIATVKSSVMQSEEAFLKGRLGWLQKNAGHEDEILYYFAGAWAVWNKDDDDFISRWNAYEKVNDKDLREELYAKLFDDNVNTKEMKEYLEFIDRVGMVSDWRRLHAQITRVANQQSAGTTTNLTALTPQQPRSAMKYLDIIKVLVKKTKWGSNIPELVRLLVDEALLMLHVDKDADALDNSLITTLRDEATSAITRHKHYFTPLYKNVLKKIKDNKKNRGARSAKTDKLSTLSGVLADVGMEEVFSVMDRTSETEYRITTVNLKTGSGLQLGHINPGAEFTDENTFLQFEKDNNFNQNRKIQKDYWKQYKKWATTAWKGSTDEDDTEAYENTIQFCNIMIGHGQLI
jgi:hypothetical protein